MPGNHAPKRPESETLLGEILTLLVDLKYDSPRAFEAIGGENILETLEETSLFETEDERRGYRNALNALTRYHALATQKLDFNAPELISFFVEFVNALPIWKKEKASP